MLLIIYSINEIDVGFFKDKHHTHILYMNEH